MNIKILIIKIPTSTADETDFCTGCRGHFCYVVCVSEVGTDFHECSLCLGGEREVLNEVFLI